MYIYIYIYMLLIRSWAGRENGSFVVYVFCSSCQGSPYFATKELATLKKTCARQVALDEWFPLKPSKYIDSEQVVNY